MGKISHKVGMAMVAALMLGSPALAREKALAEPPKPTPIGNPADWFPADAYPPAARDAGTEGRTVFALDVDAKGEVTGCRIMTSSNSELLDMTTCTLLKANAHFKPAIGPKKRPVASVWKSAMRWQLVSAPPPTEAEAPAPQ